MKALLYSYVIALTFFAGPLMAEERNHSDGSEGKNRTSSVTPLSNTATNDKQAPTSDENRLIENITENTASDETKMPIRTDTLIPDRETKSGSTINEIIVHNEPVIPMTETKETSHHSGSKSLELEHTISELEDKIRVEKLLSERIFRLATEHRQEEISPAHHKKIPKPGVINQNDIRLPEADSLAHPVRERNAHALEKKTSGPLTQSERESYASGAMLWREILQSVESQKALGINISTESVLLGLNDTARNTLQVSEADITASLDALNARFIRLSAEQREKQKEAARNWLKEFRTQKGGLSENGVWYFIDKKGTGPRLKASDTVELLVSGRLPDGTLFDDAAEKNQARTVQIGALLPPVTAGLEKLSKGGHITIAVPPEKAYGEAGLPPLIPGNAMLIFDISVKDVHQNMTHVKTRE
ncbi:FKBP-type peptidyl-prolyl cis-trans isomerase [Pantoea ananatis]|uniref:FKBP-type peptidyl-prolyl cis-trans isomerase n=1 Tax=Pantoea ananas TaxID=553 RepID=UPI00287D47C9|nr:FKBP-type peptidyl-prolyl cis-trans isomerase [Pantoea ananatis]MDS7721609.1 FKBP-type peptidyl-prolyl cis-trans isomerase [Pantoea ananatis]